MYCTNCGVKNSDGARFCRSCGRPMESETIPLADEMKEAAREESWNRAGQPVTQPFNPEYGDPVQPGVQPPHPEYGNSAQYGAQPGMPSYQGNDRKKGKKGLVIAVALILAVAAASAFGFIAYKESRPMAPVEQLVGALKKNDWGALYDSVYWGTVPEYDRKTFISEARENMGQLVSYISMLGNIKVSKVAEGTPYRNSDGLICKDLTVNMSVSALGMSQNQEATITVVKSGRKFLLIPVWKISAEDVGSILD
ncbi:zinc ribbon domain-containing protein [Qiania dongpingensis]|uniref:Zinc ribbon domain-containing protein n=1 Tax=Qiania dongpingensis TaxID=2763669 RepID=A0A7G9G485_9FIRM|nr:zinc ribbon domain-containing protein [Qiania dongpingensis]QNM05617.1 zinc ribbon domain-containing protein [Qiania dongpingensis]